MRKRNCMTSLITDIRDISLFQRNRTSKHRSGYTVHIQLDNLRMSPIWLKGSLKTVWPISNNMKITDSKQNTIAFIDRR